MKRLFAVTALLLLPVMLHAQDSPTPAPTASPGYRVVIDYDRPGLSVPHWQIVVPPRGMAQYTGVPVKGNDPGTVNFWISEAGRAKLGNMLASSKGLTPCETRSKGIANMGQKNIVYTPANGEAEHCTFNFTDNKPLNDAFSYLLAIAGTVQTGLELERLHRYDRLGLDPVMIRLTDDIKQGRAAEIGAIKSTLESLVTDPALLERVRTRAQHLLDMEKLEETATP
jgi:hypothetical protein